MLKFDHELTGLTYPTVRDTIDRFEEGGWAAIRPRRRGRPKGHGRVLSAAQEEAIQRIIIDKSPEQLKMDFFLWSRAAVGQLIEQEYGIKLLARSVGKYLPSYSPQLNPEERLNADLKQEMSKRVPVRTKAKLRQAATEHMSTLEQTPERVIGYFQDRHVRYTA